MQLGVAWLTGKLGASASVPITYWVGASAIPMMATLGSQLLKLSDGRGNTKLERADRDFIIPVALLVLAGNPFVPTAGHKIDLVLNGVTERYEVAPVGTPPAREPEWRYSDPFNTLVRVHTKFLQTV